MTTHIKNSKNYPIVVESVPEASQSASTGHPLSRYRYVSLVAFLLACTVNSLPLQALTSINSLVQDKFNYSSVVIAFCGLLGPIMHPIMATPCNMILDRFGVRIGCTIGGIFVILGAWSRCLMEVDNAFWCIFGSVFLAIGNLFVLSSPSAFALKWFQTSSGPKIISAAVLINFLSSGVGSSLGGILVSQKATSQQIKKYLVQVAIISTIPFLIFFIFFRQKPKNPPSRAAANKSMQKGTKQPYIETVKKLMKNKSYIKVIIAMSFSYGVFISFATVLDQGLKALGYQKPNIFTSTVILFAMLAGVISSFLFSYAMRVTRQYKNIISLCLLGAFLNFALLLICTCFKLEIIPLIAVLSACAGFFVIPVASLFAAYASQLTFPVGQGSATGYLFAGAQTIGFIFGLFWVSIINKTTDVWKVYLMWFFHAFLLFLAFIINMKTAEHLNKTNYQQGQAIQKLQENQNQSQSRPDIVDSLLSDNQIRKNSNQ